MNFFLKNRFLFWTLIFLVVINVSVLVTFLVFFTRPQVNAEIPADSRPGMALRERLGLSEEQFSRAESILANYRDYTQPLTSSIRDHRLRLIEELAKENPDTALLSDHARQISRLQEQMQMASINQYLDLKKICSPGQLKQLSTLYFDLYGCGGPGMGKGKGMMHRYRWGKRNQ
jgi:hypothetical protein